MQKKRLSVKDTAEILGVHPEYLRQLMRNKQIDIGTVIKPARAGGNYQYLIFRDKVNKLIGKEKE